MSFALEDQEGNQVHPDTFCHFLSLRLLTMSSPSTSSSSGMTTPESSSAGNMNIEDLIKLLTLDEKVALTRGTCLCTVPLTLA